MSLFLSNWTVFSLTLLLLVLDSRSFDRFEQCFGEQWFNMFLLFLSFDLIVSLLWVVITMFLSIDHIYVLGIPSFEHHILLRGYSSSIPPWLQSHGKAGRFAETLKRAFQKAQGTPTDKELQQFLQIYHITPKPNTPSTSSPADTVFHNLIPKVENN